MSIYDCADCGVNTASICEFPYVVKDAIWKKYGVPGEMRKGSMLCIGCLENRMGKTLTRNDFVFTDRTVASTYKGVFYPAEEYTLGWLKRCLSSRLKNRIRARRSRRLT